MGKLLAKADAETVREYLEPLQVGVGTKLGAESVVHVVRQWLGRHRTDTERTHRTGKDGTGDRTWDSGQDRKYITIPSHYVVLLYDNTITVFECHNIIIS